MSTTTTTTVPTVNEAKAFARKVGGRFATATTKVDSLVIECAEATHGAYASGLLSKTRNAGEMTQAEYVAMFSLSSTSVVTYWASLGVAYFGLGIDPKSDLGRVLRTGKAAQNGSVRKALDDPKATVESVTEAVAALYDIATGKRQPRPTGAVGGNAANGGNAPGPDVAAIAESDANVAALAAVKALDDSLKSGVTPEVWSQIESRLADIVTREVTLRLKSDTKAARPASKRTTKAAATKAA